MKSLTIHSIIITGLLALASTTATAGEVSQQQPAQNPAQQQMQATEKNPAQQTPAPKQKPTQQNPAQQAPAPKHYPVQQQKQIPTQNPAQQHALG